MTYMLLLNCALKLVGETIVVINSGFHSRVGARIV